MADKKKESESTSDRAKRHVALHSHFLCVLIVIYISILLNSALGFHSVDKVLGHPEEFTTTTTVSGGNITSTSTASPPTMNREPEPFYNFAWSCSVFGLHGFCLFIVVLALVFNNLEFCAKIIPPLMHTVLLFISAIVNLAGTILLGVASTPLEEATHEPKYSYLLRSITYVSALTTALAIVIALMSMRCPARKTKKYEDSDRNSVEVPRKGERTD